MLKMLTGISCCFVSWNLVVAQEQNFTLRVNVPVVSLDVSVTDSIGNPLNTLTREDFKVYENGTLQNLRYFSPSTAPYNVYLLFDSSGSTQHKWNFMQLAVTAFSNLIKPQDRISIGIFDESFQEVVSWNFISNAGVEMLNPLIKRQKYGGTTEFYKTIEEVLENSFDQIRERRAVITLTDGRDTSFYRTTIQHNRIVKFDEDRKFNRLLKVAKQKRIPLYFVAINTDFNLDENIQGGNEYQNLKVLYKDSLLPDAYLEEVRLRMEHLAEVSGGRVLFPRELNDVIPLYEEIAQQLGTAYSLGYVPLPPVAGEGTRRIIVRVGNEEYRVRQSRTVYHPKKPNP